MILKSVGSIRGALLAPVLGLLLGGCALTFDARSLGVPAQLSAPASAPAAGEAFSVTQTSLHLLWGLHQARGASLQTVLAGQLVEGRAVQDLRIRVRRRWSDVLVTVLTVGIFVPTSVTYEGVVTRGGP